MFTATYICSQIFIVIDYIFLVITYQLRNRKKILLLNIGAQIFTGLSYFCLNAYSAVAMAIIAIIRDIIFILTTNKKNKTIENISFSVIVIAMIIFGIITYETPWSILPVIATILYTFSIYQKNIKHFKLLGMIVSLCWILYNSYLISMFGIILETILLISSVIGYFRDMKDMKNIKEPVN